MAQVKWLGEGDDGPDEIQAYGRTIKKGESVEINDERFVRKAASNKAFEVSGGPPDVKPVLEEDQIPEFLPAYPGPNLGEHVKNAGFNTEEEQRLHHEASIEQTERFNEIQEKQGNLSEEQSQDSQDKRGPGRPKGAKSDPKKERIPPT